MNIIDKLNTITENVPKVFQAGKDAEWNAFWDNFQDYGNRVDYHQAFRRWNDNMFNPKYDILPVIGNYMFLNTTITNLKAILERNNIVLYTTEVSNADNMFQSSRSITEIPELNLQKSKSYKNIFDNCSSLISVDKIIINDNGQFDSAFINCGNLQTIIFEGLIGNDIDLHWSINLSHESLISIINCLKDYSEDTSGTVHTLTIGDTNQAKLTSEEIAIATEKGWTVA